MLQSVADIVEEEDYVCYLIKQAARRGLNLSSSEVSARYMLLLANVESTHS